MNWRRLMGPIPRPRITDEVSRLRALHCSKGAPLMSALGQSRQTSAAKGSPDVRYASNTDRIGASQRNVALCHKATFAPAAIAAYRVTFPFGDSGPSRPWLRSRAPGRLHHFGRWFWLKDG
jgi:hypothetical protein